MFINNGKQSCRRQQGVITGRAARLPPLTAGEQEGLRIKVWSRHSCLQRPHLLRSSPCRPLLLSIGLPFCCYTNILTDRKLSKWLNFFIGFCFNLTIQLMGQYYLHCTDEETVVSVQWCNFNLFSDTVSQRKGFTSGLTEAKPTPLVRTSSASCLSGVGYMSSCAAYTLLCDWVSHDLALQPVCTRKLAYNYRIKGSI